MPGRLFIILALLVSGPGAAHATATLSCSADDKVLEFDAMAVVGHGRHYPIEQFRGELKLRLKDMPEDRKVLTMADEHLTHRCLLGRDLKLLIFQEQPGASFPSVELVIQTRRKPGEDADSVRVIASARSGSGIHASGPGAFVPGVVSEAGQRRP